MIKHPSAFEALLELVDKAGSQSELARNLGVSNTAVWKWLRSSRRITAEYVLSAERLYGVSRHSLRPDIYPRESVGKKRNSKGAEAGHRLSGGRA